MRGALPEAMPGREGQQRVDQGHGRRIYPGKPGIRTRALSGQHCLSLLDHLHRPGRDGCIVEKGVGSPAMKACFWHLSRRGRSVLPTMVDTTPKWPTAVAKKTSVILIYRRATFAICPSCSSSLRGTGAFAMLLQSNGTTEACLGSLV